MITDRIPRIPRVLLAVGLLAGAAAAQAASGFTINPNQESLVTPGMTAAQVRQALGRPEHRVHYRNEPGMTFTYHVVGGPEVRLFDVDFDAAGRVASTSERMDDVN